MLKKHHTLIGITTSLLLLFISTSYYPGGTQQDKNTIGYDMKNNKKSKKYGRLNLQNEHTTHYI